MMKIYEKLEEYIKMLETVPKDKPICISDIRTRTENGLIMPSIVLQVVVDNDVCHMHKYTDTLPMFQTIPGGFFSDLPDKAIAESAYKSYTDSYEDFNKKVLGEFEKMQNIILKMGFKIEIAFIQ